MLHYFRAWAVPKGTSKLHEDVDQMFMVPTPSLHLCPQREFPVISWQRKRRLGPGLLIVPHDVQAPPRRDSCSKTVSFWDIPERQWDQQRPRCNTIPQCDQPVTWWQVDYIGKLLLVDLTNQYGEKSTCQFNSYIADTRAGVDLLKQWNHIWYHHCHLNHYKIKLMIIHYHFPRSISFLLQRSNRWFE